MLAGSARPLTGLRTTENCRRNEEPLPELPNVMWAARRDMRELLPVFSRRARLVRIRTRAGCIDRLHHVVVRRPNCHFCVRVAGRRDTAGDQHIRAAAGRSAENVVTT